MHVLHTANKSSQKFSAHPRPILGAIYPPFAFVTPKNLWPPRRYRAFPLSLCTARLSRISAMRKAREATETFCGITKHVYTVSTIIMICSPVPPFDFPIRKYAANFALPKERAFSRIFRCPQPFAFRIPSCLAQFHRCFRSSPAVGGQVPLRIHFLSEAFRPSEESARK